MGEEGARECFEAWAGIFTQCSEPKCFLFQVRDSLFEM